MRGGQKNEYENFVVEKGNYPTETVHSWVDKTHCIKDVFEEMFKDVHANRLTPCMEAYKNDDEMMCMVKTVE